jgi:hypothetical protein
MKGLHFFLRPLSVFYHFTRFRFPPSYLSSLIPPFLFSFLLPSGGAGFDRPAQRDSGLYRTKGHEHCGRHVRLHQPHLCHRDHEHHQWRRGQRRA